MKNSKSKRDAARERAAKVADRAVPRPKGPVGVRDSSGYLLGLTAEGVSVGQALASLGYDIDRIADGLGLGSGELCRVLLFGPGEVPFEQPQSNEPPPKVNAPPGHDWRDEWNLGQRRSR